MKPRMISAARSLGVVLLSAGLFHGAHADDGAAPANEIRIGAYFIRYGVTADDLSGPFTPSGINLRVGSVTTPYFAYLRSLDTNWVVELAAGVPPTTHTYGKGPATVGSVPFNDQEVATAKWFSPSVLLEYKFRDASSALRPYVGVGINYTRFYDLQSTAAGDASNGGPTHISLSRSWGPAATAGASWRITREFDLMASYSVAKVNSHYSSNTAGVVRETMIHFNPRTWVLAAGYSF